MPHDNPVQHMTFRNGYRWSFPVQKDRWLWTAPVSTSQPILHCNSYVALIIIRLVFNCSYPTVGVNWGTHVPWDLSLQQPRHMCHHMHTLSPTGLSNSEHERERWVHMTRNHLCTSEALAEEAFAESFFSKNEQGWRSLFKWHRKKKNRGLTFMLMLWI